jgi:hypothetical protein
MGQWAFNSIEITPKLTEFEKEMELFEYKLLEQKSLEQKSLEQKLSD